MQVFKITVCPPVNPTEYHFVAANTEEEAAEIFIDYADQDYGDREYARALICDIEPGSHFEVVDDSYGGTIINLLG